MTNPDEHVEPVIDALSRIHRRVEEVRTSYAADLPIPVPIGPGTWLIDEISVTTVRRAADALEPPTVTGVMGHGKPAKADGTADRRRASYWTALPPEIGEAIVRLHC